MPTSKWGYDAVFLSKGEASREVNSNVSSHLTYSLHHPAWEQGLVLNSKSKPNRQVRRVLPFQHALCLLLTLARQRPFRVEWVCSTGYLAVLSNRWQLGGGSQKSISLGMPKEFEAVDERSRLLPSWFIACWTLHKPLTRSFFFSKLLCWHLERGNELPAVCCSPTHWGFLNSPNIKCCSPSPACTFAECPPAYPYFLCAPVSVLSIQLPSLSFLLLPLFMCLVLQNNKNTHVTWFFPLPFSWK